MAKNTIKVGKLYIEKFRHRHTKNIAFINKVVEDHVEYFLLGSENIHFTSIEWFTDLWIPYETV